MKKKALRMLALFITLAFSIFPPPFSGNAGAAGNGYFHGANLSTGEISLYEDISKKFQALKKNEYSKKNIFLAVECARTGKLIFTSDRDFYASKKIPPGSLIKILSAALLLSTEGFDEKKTFYCADSSTQNGYKFTCSYKGGHGSQDLNGAFVHSCNLYFQRQMRIVPREKFTAAIIGLGFTGKKEAAAIASAPDHLYYQAVIGDYGVYATPAEFLSFIRLIAAPGSAGTQKIGSCGFTIDGRDAEKINTMLANTVRTGTAAAVLGGSDCAGKTGSPKISVEIKNGRRTVRTSAVFCGYSPYVNPKYVFFAYCDNGMGGSEAAAITKAAIEAVENARLE